MRAVRRKQMSEAVDHKPKHLASRGHSAQPDPFYCQNTSMYMLEQIKQLHRRTRMPSLSLTYTAAHKVGHIPLSIPTYTHW